MSDNNTCSCNCGKDSKERVALELMKFIVNEDEREYDKVMILNLYQECISILNSTDTE